MIKGGHDVPVADIRRRFARSLVHLAADYAPLADRWEVWDNQTSPPKLLAHSAAWQKLSVRKTVASVSRSSADLPKRQSLPVPPALSGSLRAGTPAMTDTPPEFAEDVC